MISGTLKSGNPSTVWGFMEGDDGEDYFIHTSKVRKGQSINHLSRAKLDVSQGQRDPEAENVTLY